MARTVHHLNCGTFQPLGGRRIDGKGSFTHVATLVCHCLLVQLPDALVLIDAGIGLTDIADPTQRLGVDFLRRVRPMLDRTETAVQQVARLGYEPQDVRHIVLTHLDRDHAGGPADFPDAKVHVHQPTLQAALHPATRRDQDRHRSRQWAHGPKWQSHPTDGEQWLTESDSPHCPPGLRFFQRKAQADQQVRLDNQRRLRELRAAGAVTVCSAHDPVEFGALSTR
ncbi:MAG: MBL fold metallo-hydrolase [Pseudonocardiales bacterium]|nr:MAG: MBL fold metallo-hydrolase [Pseudonocardiales bacterium]